MIKEKRDTEQKIISDIMDLAYVECEKGNFNEECSEEEGLKFACRMYKINFKNMAKEIYEHIDFDEMDYFLFLVCDDCSQLYDMGKISKCLKNSIYKLYKTLINAYYQDAVLECDDKNPNKFEMQKSDYLHPGD